MSAAQFTILSPASLGRDVHSAFGAGDQIVVFRCDPVTQTPGLEIWPRALAGQTVEAREFLTEHEVEVLPEFMGKQRANMIDCLVQVKLAGDVYPNAFATGRTMRGGASVGRLRLSGQEVTATGLRTLLTDEERGMEYEHRLEMMRDGLALRVSTLARNKGSEPVTLEALSSFSLGGLTPFAPDDAPGRLRLHRFRSSWSAEGRLDSRSFEELQLERSWAGYGVSCERFGQVGSMPVRGWFPFAAVEDTGAGVVWAVKLAWPGSWQIEVYRRHDRAAISGGLADREFGHWMKTLPPGECFETPEAFVTVVAGNLDDACDRLNAVQPVDIPEEDKALPPIFNEWCYSWGEPTHDAVVEVARRLRDSGVRYVVVDDGWAERRGRMFQKNGDWIVNRKAFPGGLLETSRALRDLGFVLGIWFEFEVANDESEAWNRHAEHFLKRDGKPLEVGSRRFWDFRDPWVHEYLFDKVIRLLKENEIGYLKVDYNDSIGIGCDGAESLGQGLYDHLRGVQRFFERIRQELPGLVIENCSSGGHRLEPSMLALTAMSSFSDAHETPEIPIIAANLLRLVPARQLQIWAVLRPEDTPERTVYSLAAAMIGRACLSGPVDKLDEKQLAIMRQALRLYQRVSPLLPRGVSRRFGNWGESWRHPTGWQAVRRISEDGGAALVVAHCFKNDGPVLCDLPLPEGGWQICEAFSAEGDSARVSSGRFEILFQSQFRGGAWLLTR